MDLLSEYKTWLENEDRSQTTIIGYTSDASQLITWFESTNGEKFKLENFTPTDVREYRNYLQTVQGLKASTVNRKLASLASLMSWGVESGRISYDPTEKMKFVKKVRTSPKWLDKHEQFALQRAIEKDLQIAQLRYPKRWTTRRRDASMVLFMLNTGLRLSETISLNLDDLEISERKGRVLIRQGKGNKERVVPLNTEAREAVQAWLKVRPESNCKRLWLAVEGGGDQGLTPRTVQRILRRYGQEAGIPNLTPHVLRHSFAKNRINKGVGVEQVAQLLGHKNLNTTQIYIQPGYRDLEQAVED